MQLAAQQRLSAGRHQMALRAPVQFVSRPGLLARRPLLVVRSAGGLSAAAELPQAACPAARASLRPTWSVGQRQGLPQTSAPASSPRAGASGAAAGGEPGKELLSNLSQQADALKDSAAAAASEVQSQVRAAT